MILSKNRTILAYTIECIVFIPMCLVMVYRFWRCREHESWSANKQLRILWYLQFVFVFSLPYAPLVDAAGTIVAKGDTREFLLNFRFVIGQCWYYVFASIQLLLCLIVGKTVLKSRRESYEHLYTYRIAFIIPIGLYLSTFPMFTFDATKEDPSLPESDICKIANVGGFLCSLMVLYCGCWLIMEFRKLILEVESNQYTKKSAIKNILIWKRFLIFNILFSFLMFGFIALLNIDEFIPLNILYNYESDENQYGILRTMANLFKLFLSVLLVFFSPFSGLKIKKKRGQKFEENRQGLK